MLVDDTLNEIWSLPSPASDHVDLQSHSSLITPTIPCIDLIKHQAGNNWHVICGLCFQRILCTDAEGVKITVIGFAWLQTIGVILGDAWTKIALRNHSPRTKW
jgi:hypothetical protein